MTSAEARLQAAVYADGEHSQIASWSVMWSSQCVLHSYNISYDGD